MQTFHDKGDVPYSEQTPGLVTAIADTVDDIDFDEMGREVREAYLRGEIVDTGMLDGEDCSRSSGHYFVNGKCIYCLAASPAPSSGR
jgi:hypothetical protein